jgi:voltage-gated potassium channel
MANLQPPSLWRRLRWPAVLLIAVTAYGVAGFALIEHWSVLDAVYMTVTTLTTVGFREVHPLDSGGMVFAISLIVLGVGVVLVTVSIVAGWVAEGGGVDRTRRARMQRQIDRMSNHAIVCAYGRVGRAIARTYQDEGVPFVVIEAKEEHAEQLAREGAPYVIGEAADEAVLRSAGVERARLLACAVDSDATNVYIALVARSINPGLFIVARASEPDSPDRLLRAGADRVVSPFVSSGRHMAMLSLRPRVVDYLEVGQAGPNPLRLDEVVVEPDSAMVGQSIGDIVGGASVLAVRHADGQVQPNPRSDQRLHPGDMLLLLGEHETLRSAERP